MVKYLHALIIGISWILGLQKGIWSNIFTVESLYITFQHFQKLVGGSHIFKVAGCWANVIPEKPI